MTVQARRSRKVEELARIYDDEIAPCWGMPFGKLLLRNLVIPERGQVLDVACGTGYPTIEIVRRMPDGARLVAIDESSAMLDVVRRKVAALGPLGKGPVGKKVFFRTESAVPKLSFADDVYDLVVCNLGLGDMPSVDAALADFARVAKPGGEVRCTLPLAGTFEEFHDLYREVLVKHDKHEALDRLELHLARYPTFDHVERCLATAGLTGGIEVEEFSLLFRSSREFFFAPVIEYGPLAAWRTVAGGGQEMQDVFWYIKEAIDAYFGGRPFHVTVKAGLVIGKKPERRRDEGSPEGRTEGQTESQIDRSDGAPEVLTADSITIPVALTYDADDSLDPIETGLPWSPEAIADGSVRVADHGDPATEELVSADHALDEDAQELDAFKDGKHRPPGLVD